MAKDKRFTSSGLCLASWLNSPKNCDLEKVWFQKYFQGRWLLHIQVPTKKWNQQKHPKCPAEMEFWSKNVCLISSSSFVSCQFAVLSQLTRSPVENELSWSIKRKLQSLKTNPSIFGKLPSSEVTWLKKYPRVSMYFIIHLSIRMVPCSIFMLL